MNQLSHACSICNPSLMRFSDQQNIKRKIGNVLKKNKKHKVTWLHNYVHPFIIGHVTVLIIIQLHSISCSKVMIIHVSSMKSLWLSPNQQQLLLWESPHILVSSECWGQRANKACKESHCGKVTISSRVLHNRFQNIRCTMEHHEGHHKQVDKMDISKNRKFL